MFGSAFLLGSQHSPDRNLPYNWCTAPPNTASPVLGIRCLYADVLTLSLDVRSFG
jgi:hypothetical protein